MSKYSVDTKTKEKSGHPILTCICIIAVVMLMGILMGYLLFGHKIVAAMTANENNAKQMASNTTNTEGINVGSIDNPAGATFECDLVFLGMDRLDITTLLPVLPDQPTNPDRNKLQADTEYIVQFNFPDMLRAEIENDNYNFDISAKYEFEVEAGNLAHFQVKLYNNDTGNLYVANGAVLTADDLCLKHSFGKSGNLISSDIKFNKDCFEFSVYTSALPDAGPKTTTDSAYSGWGYSLNYTIAGMTADEWTAPL